MRIQNPNDPNGSSYNEWPNSAIVTKTISLHFEGYAASGLAWQRIDFLGPNSDWAREMVQREPEGTGSYSASSGKGTSSNRLTYDLPWNTQDPGGLNRGYNGNFTIQYYVQENFASGHNCSSTSRFNCVDRKFRINNPPSPVEWLSGPTASKQDGRPEVRISWSYGGNEPDMREFAIYRDGYVIAHMNFAGPGTYSFDDKSYSDSGYAGSHAYSVMALRTSSVGPNKCSGTGTYGTTCVGKSSGNRSVSLAEPTQSTGTNPTGSPTSGGGSGGSKGGLNPGFRPAPVGTVIVGGRQVTRSACPDCNEFYEGSYDTKLPYNDRTVLIPGRTNTRRSGNQVVELADDQNSAPLGVPIRDRSVLLPFAGGLLLFLAAMHVRRLLRRI